MFIACLNDMEIKVASFVDGKKIFLWMDTGDLVS